MIGWMDLRIALAVAMVAISTRASRRSLTELLKDIATLKHRSMQERLVMVTNLMGATMVLQPTLVLLMPTTSVFTPRLDLQFLFDALFTKEF